MAMHPTWSEWFTNHPSNDAGNLNLQAFSDILSSGDTEATTLQQVTEEIDTVNSGKWKQWNHIAPFPKELWRNKDNTSKQTSMHGREGLSGSKHSR